MIYAFIDTSVWYRVITQGRPGCEIEALRELKTLVDKSKITILHPEIVDLELDKMWRWFPDELEAKFKLLIEAYEKSGPLQKPIWSEMDDIQFAIQPFLKDRKAEKVKDAKERHKEVMAFLKSPKTKKLPFTPDVLFKAKRRLISGKVARNETKDNDLSIIELLIGFFADHDDQEPGLYFCSGNTKDFGLEQKDGGYILHPYHRTALSGILLTHATSRTTRRHRRWIFRGITPADPLS